MNTELPTWKLVLGSASPRRQELLSLLGHQFIVCKPQVEERRLPHESIEDYMERNVIEKAISVGSQLSERIPHLILAADTAVICDEQLLEKPRSRDDAARMLQTLSGRWHEVVTVFAIWSQGAVTNDKQSSLGHHSIRTKVEFAVIPPRELERYLDSSEPYDKAGAYAIQGVAGKWVRQIEGSYSNVVGLPLCEVREQLQEFSILAAPASES